MFWNGLKKLIKIPIFLILYLIFVLLWISVIINGFLSSSLIGNVNLFIFIITVSISFTLFIFSFFKRIQEMGWIYILIILIFSIGSFLILFFFLVEIAGFLFNLFFYLNQLFTALFAFKFCMDSATKVDDYLYLRKGKKITRSLEFIVFGMLDMLLLLWSWRYFLRIGIQAQFFAPIFFLIIWVNLALMIFVIIRLVIKKKFSAYITLFFVLNFFYVLYIIFSVLFNLIYTDAEGFRIVSFLIDLLIFTIILGSILDKTDYLEEKLKIIKADTFAIFFFILKVFVQISDIRELSTPFDIYQEIIAAWVLFTIFIGATLIFGIYSIFAHKEGKRNK